MTKTAEVEVEVEVDIEIEVEVEVEVEGRIGRFRYIAWVKCPYRVAGKASALGAGSDIPKSAYWRNGSPCQGLQHGVAGQDGDAPHGVQHHVAVKHGHQPHGRALHSFTAQLNLSRV